MNNNKIIHLPGLNGLRAIAAIAVVISHITLVLKNFGLDPGIFGRDDDGNPIGLLLAGFGVSIFFALSGFLITYLLLKEKEIARINIKKFYVRRILRIWPLYYLYFAICLSIAFITGLSYSHSAILYYIFLSADISFLLGQALPYLVHYWSLGVEEQFYIFWPWIARIENKKLLKGIFFACLLLVFIKIISRPLHLHIASVGLYDIIHVIRFHCMLIGAMGAILYYQGNQKFISFSTNIIVQSVSWFIILLTIVNKFHIASVIDNELISCISVFLILGQITGRNKIINLNNTICNFLGKISYGLYVIHPLIILAFSFFAFKNLNCPPTLKYIIVYSSILVTTILVAFVSYNLYEKRFLKLKRTYAVVKSSDVKQDEKNYGDNNTGKEHRQSDIVNLQSPSGISEQIN